MTTLRTRDHVSRRAALAGLGAGGLAVALGATGHPAAAQDAPTDAASHPIVGAWLVSPRSPNGGFESISFGADGTVIQGWTVSAADQQGVTFSGSGLGVWEPVDARTVAFTAVTALSDVAGTNLGTLTVDGYIEVAEDGQTWIDDQSSSGVTIRDKEGAVVLTIADPTLPPVTATRIRVRASGFPETAATPTP
jgi:hypothetical protein